MATFSYTALDAEGKERSGTIDAVNIDVAITGLQRRGLIISNIDSAEKPASILERRFSIFDRIKNSDIVILSRQL